MPTHVPLARVHALVVATLLALGPSPAEPRSSPAPATADPVPGADPMTVRGRVRAVIVTMCGDDDPPPAAFTRALGGPVELSREPLRVRDRTIGTRHSLTLRDGARVRIDRVETDGILRRVVASYAEPGRSGPRPVLLAVADGGCNVTAGRRLTYDADGTRRSIEYLDGSLEQTTRVEPLNPPVPRAPVREAGSPGVREAGGPGVRETGGPGSRVAGGPEAGSPGVREAGGPGVRKAGSPEVRVALVDSGVNYLLPEIASRLARDVDGGLVGFDFWDLDARPFDANPARSAFHPQRHGTRTASLLLEEAPVAALVPYRYPRHAMSRMPDLVGHAAAAGVRIVNLSMGSRRRSEWADFEAAARAHPEILFVVSAGNDGVDIDEAPVFPASLPLDNLLTVTSADDSGLPARGSNLGRESVDLAVPAEQVLVTGFDGRVRKASGSSYAAARVSAFAACLLAAHPEWTTPELKSAVMGYAARPASDLPARVGAGSLPDPTGIDRGACEAERDDVTETALGAWTPERLHREGVRSAHSRTVAPAAVIPDEGVQGAHSRTVAPAAVIPGEGAWPARAPAHTHTVALDVVILSGTGWPVAEVRRAVGRASEILAQCGVSIDRARLRGVEGPRRFRYLDDTWSRRLVKRVAPARPAVFFVEDTLRRPAFEAEAFGQGNTRRTPGMRDTVWITRAVTEAGVVLAHELFHVLADLGRHETDPDNLMHERINGASTRLHDWQCERLRKVATAFGLAKPVRRGTRAPET